MRGRASLSGFLMGLLAWAAIVLASCPAAGAEAGKLSLLDWTKKKIADGAIVDLVQYGPECAVGKRDDRKSWDHVCQLPASLVTEYLTDPKLSALLGRRGLRFRHVHLMGDLDLAEEEVAAQLWIDDSLIDGRVDLTAAHFHRLISFDHSIIAGPLEAERLVADLGIFMSGRALIVGDADFSDATVHGEFNARGITIQGKFSGSGAHFGADVYLDDEEKGDSVIHGGLFLNAVTIDGRLSLQRQYVGTSSEPSDLVMEDANIHNSVFASYLRVFGKADLNNAHIAGNLDLTGAHFADMFDGSSLSLANTLSFQGAWLQGRVILTDARLTTGLMLWNSHLTQLDLTNVDMEELLIRGAVWQCMPEKPAAKPAISQVASVRTVSGGQRWSLSDGGWKTASCAGRSDADALPSLRLRNAHVGALEEAPDAWPPVIDLLGFHYERLGSTSPIASQFHAMHNTVKQWTNWIARQPDFSPQPYVQLASVLQAEGMRQASDDILFAARERERRDAAARLQADIASAWRSGHIFSALDTIFSSFARWAFLSSIGYMIGYGIGAYTFRVLIWLGLLTLIATVTLYFSPRLSNPSPFASRARGLVWRMGAGLQTVIPIVEYYKPFKVFTENAPPKPEDPDQRRNLSPGQAAIFGALAISGWVLSGFLVAAVTGLTQKG